MRIEKRLWPMVLVLAVTIRPSIAAAGQQTGESAVRIPVGTKIAVSGEGLKFLLPDGPVEILPGDQGLAVGIYDASGKLISSGNQARLFAECDREKLLGSPETTSDMRFIRFVGMSPQPDPPGKAVLIPKGTKIEKISDTQIRFILADGDRVDFRCQGAKSGDLGDCTRYSGGNKLLYSRSRVRLCHMVELQDLRKTPAVEDSVTWVQFVLR
ncbi:MAG: hypothetical protein ACYDH0_00115 [Candidatus Aminicenantales bacterium]